MAEKIVGLISCLLCAVPFLIIGIFEKNSKEPITFWSGDKTLVSVYLTFLFQAFDE